MNNKSLYYLLGSLEAQEKLKKAQRGYLKTLPYDEGMSVKEKSGRYFDIGGTLSAVNSIGKSVFKDSLDNTYEDIKARKEYNNRSALSGISDNDALLSAFENLQWGQQYKDKDFRSESVMDDVSDTLMAGVTGAMTTGNWVGAAVGAGLVGGRKIVDRIRANREKKEANADMNNFNASLATMLSNTAANVDTLNDRRRLYSYFNSNAFGGVMSTHGGDFQNGLTFINAGGTHESNPNDGVPAGVDEQGIPNLVEEGEVIWNNEYVFSNRLKVPKKLRDKYKLNDSVTYAEAIKKVTKENENRKNDPISNDTTKAIVNEFIDSQEEVRMKRQQRAAARLQQAQLENDLIQALAGLGGEPQSAAPMNVQAPVQQVPQEAPVIEQVGAYGGRFDTGGPKRGGLDPLLTKQFPKDPSLMEYLVYKSNAEYDPTMPEVYPYNFKTRVQAKRAYNAEAERIKNIERKRRIQNSKLYKWADSIDNKYFRDTFIESPKEYRIPQVTNILFEDGGNLFVNGGYEAIRKRPTNRYDRFGQPIYEYIDSDGTVHSTLYDAKRAQDKIDIKSTTTRKPVPGMGHIYVDTDGNQYLSKKEAKRGQKELNKKTFDDYKSKKAGEVLNGDIEPAVIAANTQDEQMRQAKLAEEERQRKLAEQRAREEAERNQGGSNQGNGGIPYDRSKSESDVREFENQADYKNFLSLVRSHPEIANQWIDRLNNGEFGSLNGYNINSIDDWYRLATDGKMGPIHNATLAAAQAWRAQESPDTKSAPQKVREGFGLPQVDNDLAAILDEYNNTIMDRRKGNTELNVPTNYGNGPKDKSDFFDPRKASIYGSALAALNGLFNRPDYSNADAIIEAAEKVGAPVNIPVQTIGDYVKRRPFDERYLVNMANQNMAAAARSAANTSGGNRAMQLGVDAALTHSNQTNLGEIMRQAYLANRQDEMTTAEFNRGTNLQNMNAINSRNLAQAQLNSQRQQAALSGIASGRQMRQGIYDNWTNATGQNLSNLFNSLGLYGKEKITDNTIQSMVDNGWGMFKYNKDGTLEFIPNETKFAKCGGNLKKKRRF